MGGAEMELQSCAASLRIFAGRDFSQWTGLAPSCSLEEVIQSFPLLNEGVGLARLGRKKRQFRMLVVEGFDHPVRVWLDGAQVLLLDVQYPEISPSLPLLLEKLGDPSAKLDYDHGAI